MKKLLKKFISETSPVWLLQHKARSFAAALRYGFPARRLVVLGVTGTDGKTTTVGMIAHILNANGKKCGALSTALIQLGTKMEWNPTQKTSPSPFMVQNFLKRCASEGCTHVVLEYSSHGLLQSRLDYTWPLVAGITNLSEEHLDYHNTMDAYLAAKSILFRMLDKKNGLAVLNADDRSHELLLKITTPWRIEYSVKNACGLWLTDIKADASGVGGTLRSKTEPGTHKLSMPLAGAFNLQNALCAIGCVHGVNVPLGDAVQALSTFHGIPGRMERIDAGQDFSVFVDFTVTPQSYEKTLSTLKAGLAPGKQLLVLTGSCGDRMKEKRPVIGRIVSSYAGVMVVANEDPYTEDPEKIIDEIWTGVDQSATEAHRIFDRRKAIEYLLGRARTGDIVILCGKGSDTTMWTTEGQVPWNEREIVREILQAAKR